MQKYQNINICKWLLILLIFPFVVSFTILHPFFLSVTELNYNLKTKKLEISVKLFIDDFEKTLNAIHKIPVNLVHPKDSIASEKLVEDYIKNHLSINSDGKLVGMHFVGYEKEEEAIWSYFETDEITIPKILSITNTLLYQFMEDQVNIMHVNIGTEKKSYKLNNPESKAEFIF